MKKGLILIFIISGLASFSQSLIGMSPVFSSNPPSAITPLSSVNFSTNIALSVSVKNYGNTPFTGNIVVVAKRDTINGVICDSTAITQTLNPNDSAIITLNILPQPGPNSFKVAGNGNTIVVWPIILSGSGINGDSIKPVIWINPTTHILEKNYYDGLIYPNPTGNEVFIDKLNLSDTFTVKVLDCLGNLMLDEKNMTSTRLNIELLNSGIYFIYITQNGKNYIQKIIKK